MVKLVMFYNLRISLTPFPTESIIVARAKATRARSTRVRTRRRMRRMGTASRMQGSTAMRIGRYVGKRGGEGGFWRGEGRGGEGEREGEEERVIWRSRSDACGVCVCVLLMCDV